MYAFILYDNSHKENTFEIKYVSTDLEETKRAAFSAAKKSIPKFQDACQYYVNDINDGETKINTKIGEHHVFPINEIMVEYSLVFVKNITENPNYRPRYEIQCKDCMVYSVVKIEPVAAPMPEDTIDETFIISTY
jgi:hypothetical protein